MGEITTLWLAALWQTANYECGFDFRLQRRASQENGLEYQVQEVDKSSFNGWFCFVCNTPEYAGGNFWTNRIDPYAYNREKAE